MTKRRPYRSNAPSPVPFKGNEFDPLGFVETVRGMCANLKVDVAGLLARLRYPPYRDGVPASYVGEKTFTPESSSFTLDLFGRGDDAATQQPVNYVVRDGQRFTVPIIMDGPGVFMAKFMKVVFYQRWWSPTYLREIWLPIPQTKSFDNLDSTDSTYLQTVKWSILANNTFTDLVKQNNFGMNYFWNISDADSGRKFGNELISNTVLLPRSYRNQLDGGLMEFDTPWLFERQGRMDFEFQLINPILQLDPSATIFPFVEAVGGADIDDLENGGTERRQDVLVRVELHGTKFYNERDLLLREAAA